MDITINQIQYMEQKFIKEAFDHIPFIIEKGTHPIMLSAPHSVPQLRKGKPKMGEFLTGVLVQLIHQQTNCFAAYKTKNMQDDANFDESNPYKDALVHCIQNEQINFLIDVHIMSSKRPASIEIGTGKGKNIAKGDLSIEELTKVFQQYDIQPVIVDQLFTAGNPNTVSSTVARLCGISCIQIEINWELLNLENGEKNFLNVLNSLQNIVNLLITKGTALND
ncbi:hypothetical protein [Bacillus sp. Marseille-P3661]|uniref:hypothetical protein n=1 Tax=Bacillus sp. Marseille-P3661 TaxID=1936234 RepID=UPI000C856445|nr:hypothetical protein [Bacillus sp. Marseille-P3661]